MKAAVIDGQGGGIGRLIIEKLRQEFGDRISIVGLGTNAVAASAMLKAGANEGASGENAIIYNVKRVDVILGSVAILAAHSFLGELTPPMAEAIASAEAVKLLLPINRCGIEIAGVLDEPLPIQVDHLVCRVQEILEQNRQE